MAVDEPKLQFRFQGVSAFKNRQYTCAGVDDSVTGIGVSAKESQVSETRHPPFQPLKLAQPKS